MATAGDDSEDKLTDHELDAIFKDLPRRTLLRVDEVAKFLVVSKRKIYTLYPDILKGTYIDGIIRIYRQSVIDYVVNNDGKKKGDELPTEIDQKIRKYPDPRLRRRRFVKDW